MTDILCRIGLAAFSIATCVYLHKGVVVTIDGQRMMSSPRPSPFHLRWLVPLLVGKRVWAWAAVSWTCLLVATVLFPGDLWAAALFVCLPWFWTMASAPVLVDAPAFALSLASMRWPVVGAVGCVVSERVPVMAALMSWSAWPLIGMYGVLLADRLVPSGSRAGASAFAVGQGRAFRLFDAGMLLLPWGAGLAAVTAGDWSLRELALVVVAYGQILVAHDTSRLYQWAAPVVLPRAMAAIPGRWRFAALLATWFNPWAKVSPRQVMC